MDYFIVCLPVILPVVFWSAYHWHIDRHLPEPASHLLIAFGMGVGSYYLGAQLYGVLDLLGLRHSGLALADHDLVGLFAYSVLAIGPIEELAKLVPFLVLMPLFREFDEPIDGIVYGSFIALGFAATENVHYLEFLEDSQAYARGFAGPVVHIVFASIWGYYVGRAWLFRRRLALTILVAWALVSFVHGIYDFIVLGLPTLVMPVAALMIAGAWIWRLALIRDLHATPHRALSAGGPAR